MKKLLLITTALVAVVNPAHADPISAVAAWVGSTFAVGTATALAVTQFAFGMGLSLLSQALFKPEKPKVNVSFEVQMGDDLPLSFIVGDYATAGKRKYIGSWGKNTRFITEVIEVSALPQAKGNIWVNDEPAMFFNTHRAYIPTSLSPGSVSQIEESTSMTPSAGSVEIGTPMLNHANGNDGADDARLWIKWVDGSQLAADPFLAWAFANDEAYPWTSAMVGRGKTYLILTGQYNKDWPYQWPSILSQPAPLPMYDLRFDSTNGGSGTQRWNDRSTWQPTRNPAVIAYNIARGIYYGSEWLYGGKNLPAWRLPQAEWIAAANACDASQTRANGAVEPRYRCGMEIPVDAEPASVLEEIGKAANMKFVEVGGRLKPIVDLPGAAVFSFTDADGLITKGQSFSPFYPVSETYTAISATYPERGEKWATKDAPIYIDTDATASDGGRYLPTSMSYPAVPFAAQVQRLMRSQMRDFRRMRRHEFYLPPDAYALEPGIDMVSWSSERNGYINKQFIVERVSKTPGMNVLVSLREVDPSDYDWSSNFEQPIVITPPVNPQPFVQPINGLTVTGAIIRDAASNARRPAILVACDGDEAGVTHIQIEGRVSGRTEVSIDTLRQFSAPFSWYLLNVISGASYDVRARLLSERTPRSQWSDWITVLVPTVGLGWDDLTGEVLTDVNQLETWINGTGDLIREVMDEVGLIGDQALEGDADGFNARQQIRADLNLVAIGNNSALQALVVRVSDTEDGILAQSDIIDAVEAKTDRGTASGLLRISAESGPAGVQSRIGIRAEASDTDATHAASLYLEANADGTNQVLAVADRFAIVSSTSAGAARATPFIVDNGIVYIDIARIRNADIDTLKIAGNAITVAAAAQTLTSSVLPMNYVLTGPAGESYPVFILATWNQTEYAQAGVRVNGTIIGGEMPASGTIGNVARLITLPVGTHDIRVETNHAGNTRISLFVLATKR